MFSDTQLWWGVTTIAGLAIAAITYFLKRTIGKVDEHDKNINEIKQDYASKADLKELRTEIKAELLRITDDLSEIKEQSLGKQDFYRSIGEINESIKQLRDILMTQNGEP